jgi:c-di-GMP-binding flagellar brake protein YcgR
MMSISPQLEVRIVVETDDRSERSNARNSVIYEISRKALILAQTEPSIESSMLNKEIVVTYLVKEDGNYLRYGFSALIVDLIDQYQVTSEQHVPAIEVRRRSDPKPYNIRLNYRVEPSGKSGLDAAIHNKKVNVIDISLGGMRVNYDKSLQLETNSIIEVCLTMAGAPYTIEARIVRTWKGKIERFEKDLSFAAIEFVNVSDRTELALSRKIREIERKNVSTTSKA